MPECRWCFKQATAWIRDVRQESPGYAVCDWHADQSKRLGWRVFRPQFPEPCENCGKVWENGDCFTTVSRTVRCALIRTAKDAKGPLPPADESGYGPDAFLLPADLPVQGERPK